MAKVLFGWELGAGVGHTAPLLRIARELHMHGHEPVFALRFLAESWPLLDGSGFPVLQAPFWRVKPGYERLRFQAVSFADMLAYHGFDEPDILYPMVRAWDAILDTVKPALVVADYAPGLILAAYARIPVVLIGNGYCVPPVDQPEFPVVYRGGEPLMPQARILDSVQCVQRRRNQPTMERLTEIMDGKGRFLPSYSELDPYATMRSDVAVGPLDAYTPPPKLPDQPRFFAYLSGDHPDFSAMVRGLGQSGVPGTIYARQGTDARRTEVRAAGIKWAEKPRDLKTLLPEVSVIVHNSGLGMTTTGLATGRPQLLVPMSHEQNSNARNTLRLGTAIRLGGEVPVERAGRALQRLTPPSRCANCAQSWARALAGRYPGGSLSRIVACCLEHL